MDALKLKMMDAEGFEFEAERVNKLPNGMINLRTHKHLRAGQLFQDKFKHWKGNLYEIIY